MWIGYNSLVGIGANAQCVPGLSRIVNFVRYVARWVIRPFQGIFNISGAYQKQSTESVLSTGCQLINFGRPRCWFATVTSLVSSNRHAKNTPPVGCLYFCAVNSLRCYVSPKL